VRVFVTGATGLVGRALVGALEARGDAVVALSRQAGARVPGAAVVHGDPTAPGPWMARVAGCDAVVHLAGEPIGARRWTEARKRRIVDSRVLSTRALVAAVAAAPAAARPRVLVGASGADYYPFDDGDTPYAEAGARGDHFLAGLCAAWQAEAEAAAAHGARVVVMRTAVVLAREGGALPRMATPFKLFAGGPLGTGRQWLAWVHLEDVIGAYLLALDRDAARGPVNLVAPGIVRQRDFARALGAALRRPSWAPLPGPILRLAVGELATYLLHGRRVVPAALAALGYGFHYPDAPSALAACLG
jgi:uncharacterized protein (TIGR01777 family)